MTTTKQTDSAMEKGKQAKLAGQSPDSCEYGMAELNLRSWWFAGYNECESVY